MLCIFHSNRKGMNLCRNMAATHCVNHQRVWIMSSNGGRRRSILQWLLWAFSSANRVNKFFQWAIDVVVVVVDYWWAIRSVKYLINILWNIKIVSMVTWNVPPVPIWWMVNGIPIPVFNYIYRQCFFEKRKFAIDDGNKKAATKKRIISNAHK